MAQINTEVDNVICFIEGQTKEVVQIELEGDRFDRLDSNSTWHLRHRSMGANMPDKSVRCESRKTVLVHSVLRRQSLVKLRASHTHTLRDSAINPPNMSLDSTLIVHHLNDSRSQRILWLLV